MKNKVSSVKEEIANGPHQEPPIRESFKEKDFSGRQENVSQDPVPVETVRRSRRRFIIEPALALNMATFSSMAPLLSQFVLSEMMKEFNVTTGVNDTGSCGESVDRNSSYSRLRAEAQAASAQFVLLYTLTQGITAMFVALYLGSYSDRHGRRIALILPSVGNILCSFTFALKIAFNLPIWVTVIGTTIDGLCGSFTTFTTTCYAYISDTGSKETRSSQIMLAECIMSVLQGVLQLTMGYFIKGLGFFWAFVLVTCLYFINLIYVIFFVPESRVADTKQKSSSPFLILESFKTVIKKRSGPMSRSLLLLCLVGYVFLVFGQIPQYGLEELHLLNPPICMDSIILGFWKTTRLAIHSCSLVLFGKFFTAKLGDVNIVMFSAFSIMIYFIIFPLVNQIWMTFAILVPAFGSPMALPLSKAILSKMVSQDEQGGLMSVLYVVDMVTGLIGNAVFNNIYAATLTIFRPTTYMTMAGITGVGLAIFMIYKCKTRKTRLGAELISLKL